jgi:predicted aspartyl protease
MHVNNTQEKHQKNQKNKKNQKNDYMVHDVHTIHAHSKKKAKKMHTSTAVVGLIYLNSKSTQTRAIRVLVDTGASATVIIGDHCRKLKLKRTEPTTWTTKAGKFTTNKKVTLKFLLPEFNSTKVISWSCHIDESATSSASRYDMIIGRDLLQEIGFIIDFNDYTMTWDEATIPMKEYNSLPTLEAVDAYCDELFSSDVDHEVTLRMTRILDAKYEKADLTRDPREREHLRPKFCKSYQI